MINDNNEQLEQLVCKKWRTLCSIHDLTKKYTLLAEEYSISMSAYIQPMKEHRDAYDHLIRAYSVYCNSNNIKSDYILGNLDKAISHEYRAFYDTLDYMSIVLREIIYEELKHYSYTQIVGVYPKYEEIKKLLLLLPQNIAKHREDKDIGDEERITLANQYGKIIDKLTSCYQSLVDNVLSKIELK